VYARRKANLFKLRKEGQARNAFLEIDPRKDADLRSLGESMRVRQLHPIWVDADLYVITGHRRTLAGQMLDLEVDVVITDEVLTLADIRLIQAPENLLRVDLTPYEKWLLFKDLQELHPGKSQKELAALVNIDQSLLTRWLSPSKLIPAALELFKAGNLGISEAYALSKCQDERAQHDLLAAKVNGATRDELEAARKRQGNGTVPTVRRTRKRKRGAKLMRVVCPLASGLTVAVSAAAVSLQDVIDGLGEAVDLAKRALSEGLNAKEWTKAMQRKAKAG
jgi:ParB-like chromosome segregation protein Spo0J